MAELDPIWVEGKTEPVRIHALVGDSTAAAWLSFAARLQAQESFLVACRADDFAAARDRLDLARRAAEGEAWADGYHAAMASRLAELLADPPPVWDGVHVAMEKQGGRDRLRG